MFCLNLDADTGKTVRRKIVRRERRSHAVAVDVCCQDVEMFCSDLNTDSGDAVRRERGLHAVAAGL